MQQFDFEDKVWQPLPSIAVIPGANTCVTAKVVGNNVYVGENDANDDQCSYVWCYNTEKNLWHKLPPLLGQIGTLCAMGDYLYAISSDFKQIPQRYSFSKRQWQSIARIEVERDDPGDDISPSVIFMNGAVVLHSKLYVGYECKYSCPVASFDSSTKTTTARFKMYCFDEGQNQWHKESRQDGDLGSHFGSCLFVVTNKICLAGGPFYGDDNTGSPVSDPASVNVYDESTGQWYREEQKHIPQNNLGAVEVDGKVYFIINKFPVDSGIRIPQEDVFPVCLGDWGNIVRTNDDTALCYLPLTKKMNEN